MWTPILAGALVLLLAAFVRMGFYWTDRNHALATELDGYRKLNEAIEKRATERVHEMEALAAKVRRTHAESTGYLSEKAQAAETQLAEASAELERTRERLAESEEKLRFWMAMAEKMESRFDKANDSAIEGREIVADWVAMRTFGRSIFHKAPALPTESLHRKPVPKARIQGRLAVQLADAAFAKQEAELRRAQQAGEAPAAPPAPVRIEVTPDPAP